jgi:predicted metalloendopeptidase
MQRLYAGLALLTVVMVVIISPSDAAPLVSAIETQYFDNSVRAQDDFYQHVNGKWLATTEIPADKAGYGPAYQLFDEAQERLRAIIEDAAQSADASPGSEAQKIGDLYASFMDEPRLDALDLEPLQPELARIDALKSKAGLASLIAHLQQIGVGTPFAADVDQDNRNSIAYALYLSQSGLSLPDRDYYLKEDDPKLMAIRAQYARHVEATLALAGDKLAATHARDVMALETKLARVQWTRVENRDPVKTYNKVPVAKLAALGPGYPWLAYLRSAGLETQIQEVIVQQPSYFAGWSKLLSDTPLAVWRVYFKWHLLHDYSQYLSKRFVDERFAFYGKVVSGIPENRPRWKRGVKFVEGAIGEGLGKLYVAKYFPPESKARMDALVGNILVAYRQSIENLDWMGRDTKVQAQAKLAKLTTKIGYPRKWRDYSKLQTKRDDLVGNVMRANRFEFDRSIAKLGKPIDRDEWFMTPQTINAYYNPSMNEIVFPAAILQPPYFNPEADDATNYGAIGATIGHEISHAFDDSGSQFDGDGNLRDWWTKEDHEKFTTKTKALIDQYAAYEPVAGYHVNGALTLGENIADNSGLAIAYKAYRLSLGDKEAPIIDGFTGDQRFYLSFAQSWRDKTRDEQTIVYLKSDPHTPDKFRVNGSVVNQPAFYSAFDVKEGDKIYIPPDRRVIIW